MIDFLELRCTFKHQEFMGHKDWPKLELGNLGVPLEQSIDRNAEVYNTRHPWESIPSSYEGMAFKIFDYRYTQLDDFYIILKCSPAKIMLGHNVFGSSNFIDCCFAMMALFAKTYPQVYDELDHTTWYLNQIDITYFSRAGSQNEVKAFINSLHSVSYGQVKSRTGYDGTAYFGKKKSRLKKIKVYSKFCELLAYIDKLNKKPDGQLLIESVYTPELLAWAEKMVRWELSLYHRYLERRGIDCNLHELKANNNLSEKKLIKLWKEGLKDLFTAFEGKEMKTINDEDIRTKLRANFAKTTPKGNTSYTAADAAFRTYLLIKEKGWLNAIDLLPRKTFYRHVSQLHDCGVSRAALQNLNGLSDGSNIIPFMRFITVEFGEQFPPWFDQSTLSRVA